MDSIDLTNPEVRARVEYLGQHAEQSIVQNFLQNHQELLNCDLQADIANKSAIDAIINQNGLALTPENLEWSYRVALENGMLTLPMYHPVEEAAFPQMTTAQMKEYLTKKYQAPPKPNAAELLPTSGERMWGNETAVKDEEALAALRANLLGLK